jgi:hypothetical protein
VMHLERGRYPAAAGYSQWCMWITFNMALYHRQDLQA